MRIPVHRRRHQFGCGIAVFKGYDQYGGYLRKPGQSGYGVSVFRGADRDQYGHGFASILKSVGKFAAPLIRKALPVVLKTGKKLVKSAIQNREQGRTWGESFRERLAPAAHTALKEISAPYEPQDVPEEKTQAGKGFGIKHRQMYKSRRHIYPMHNNF